MCSYDFAMSVANDFMDIDFGPSDIGEPDLNNDFNVEFVDESDADDFQQSVSQIEPSQESLVPPKNDISVVTDLGAPLKVVRRKLEKKLLLVNEILIHYSNVLLSKCCFSGP